MFPNSQRMNRGNYVLGDIVNTCVSSGATDLIVIHEHRGQPDGLVISHLPHGMFVFPLYRLRTKTDFLLLYTTAHAIYSYQSKL